MALRRPWLEVPQLKPEESSQPQGIVLGGLCQG